MLANRHFGRIDWEVRRRAAGTARQPATRRPGMSDYHQDRNDEPLHTEKIVTDRKIYFLDLKENARGKFVKITEDVRGRRDTILLSIEALDEFIAALENIRNAMDG
jgi:hypothetical protein